MAQNKLDQKVAAYVFIAILFASLLCSILLVSMAKSAGADINNFWEESVASIVSYLLLLGVFFIICSQLKLKGPEIPQAIDLNRKVSLWNLGLVVVAGLTLVSFMLLTEGVIEIFRAFGYSTDCRVCTEEIICWRCKGLNASQYIMAIVTLCILPAIIEELLFRGLILKGLMPMGKVVAVVASALLFSLFHLNPEQTVYQFILGIVFAFVVIQTGNLLYGMILHFLNNFFVLTAYTFLGDTLKSLVWNPLTIVAAVLLAVFGALMIVGVVRTLKQHGKQRDVPKTAKFFALDNIGYFIATSLGVCIWIFVLVR